MYTVPCVTWNAHQTLATIELLEKETQEFFQLQLWIPNSSDLNPVHYSVLELLQEKVYETCITDLDELKQRLRTDSANGHVITAAAIRQ